MPTANDIATAPAGNQLIDHLPGPVARTLLAGCRPLQLTFNQDVAQAGAPVLRVLFPTTAILSLTLRVSGHRPLGMGMIGHEGMLGATLALGVSRHPRQAIVQGAGTALEITAVNFERQLSQSAALKHCIHGYLFVLAEQLAQAAACNAFHDVTSRLANWLLMMDDRARGKSLTLTHQFLSNMLGVRRSAVTIAAGQLQRKKMIRYSRGHIQVLSRSGLESVACECYSEALAAYRREFSPG